MPSCHILFLVFSIVGLVCSTSLSSNDAQLNKVLTAVDNLPFSTQIAFSDAQMFYYIADYNYVKPSVHPIYEYQFQARPGKQVYLYPYTYTGTNAYANFTVFDGRDALSQPLTVPPCPQCLNANYTNPPYVKSSGEYMFVRVSPYFEDVNVQQLFQALATDYNDEVSCGPVVTLITKQVYPINLDLPGFRTPCYKVFHANDWVLSPYTRLFVSPAVNQTQLAVYKGLYTDSEHVLYGSQDATSVPTTIYAYDSHMVLVTYGSTKTTITYDQTSDYASSFWGLDQSNALKIMSPDYLADPQLTSPVRIEFQIAATSPVRAIDVEFLYPLGSGSIVVATQINGVRSNVASYNQSTLPNKLSYVCDWLNILYTCDYNSSIVSTGNGLYARVTGDIIIRKSFNFTMKDMFYDISQYNFPNEQGATTEYLFEARKGNTLTMYFFTSMTNNAIVTVFDGPDSSAMVIELYGIERNLTQSSNSNASPFIQSSSQYLLVRVQSFSALKGYPQDFQALVTDYSNPQPSACNLIVYNIPKLQTTNDATYFNTASNTAGNCLMVVHGTDVQNNRMNTLTMTNWNSGEFSIWKGLAFNDNSQIIQLNSSNPSIYAFDKYLIIQYGGRIDFGILWKTTPWLVGLRLSNQESKMLTTSDFIPYRTPETGTLMHTFTISKDNYFNALQLDFQRGIGAGQLTINANTGNQSIVVGQFTGSNLPATVTYVCDRLVVTYTCTYPDGTYEGTGNGLYAIVYNAQIVPPPVKRSAGSMSWLLSVATIISIMMS